MIDYRDLLIIFLGEDAVESIFSFCSYSQTPRKKYIQGRRLDSGVQIKWKCTASFRRICGKCKTNAGTGIWNRGKGKGELVSAPRSLRSLGMNLKITHHGHLNYFFLYISWPSSEPIMVVLYFCACLFVWA
jgi:hypothetical protein